MQLEFPICGRKTQQKHLDLKTAERRAYEQMCNVDGVEMYRVMYWQNEPNYVNNYIIVLAKLASNIADQVGNADPLVIAHNLLCNRPELILAFYIRAADERDLARLQKYSCKRA